MVETSTLLISNLVITGLAAFCSVLSLATPYWLVEDDRPRGRNFEKAGLWEICLVNYVFPRAATRKSYTGCHNVFSKEFEEIRSIVAPGWFTSVQVLASLALALLGLSFLLLLVYYVRIYQHDIMMYVTSALLAVATIFIITAAIMFGTRSDSKEWMPDQKETYLGWSFGIHILAGFLAVLGALIVGVTILKMIFESKC